MNRLHLRIAQHNSPTAIQTHLDGMPDWHFHYRASDGHTPIRMMGTQLRWGLYSLGVSGGTQLVPHDAERWETLGRVYA